MGLALKKLLAERGVERKPGPKQDSATVALIAAELGVPERTAKHRLAQADKLEALPKKTQDDIRNRKTSITKAKGGNRGNQHKATATVAVAEDNKGA
jgi:hypothetical protein